MNIKDFLINGLLSSEHIVEGINQGDFSLVYQPIVALDSLEIIGYEALARWNFQKSGQYISPLVFMGFGDMHLMRRLTQYLLAIAEKDQKQLKHPIFFNISNYDIKAGIETSLTFLEITEEFFTPDYIDEINNLSKRKKLIMDDFGQAYSAWTWIPYLNFYKIKYDKFLIDNLVGNYKDWYYDILSLWTKQAKKYQLKTTAEGVETKEQLELLRTIGVDEGQGYLFYKPRVLSYWIK